MLGDEVEREDDPDERPLQRGLVAHDEALKADCADTRVSRVDRSYLESVSGVADDPPGEAKSCRAVALAAMSRLHLSRLDPRVLCNRTKYASVSFGSIGSLAK
jgi:hypothetical protein